MLKEFLENNLKKGFSHPSKSSASGSMLFFSMRDDCFKTAHAYRFLNIMTIRNCCLLPFISDYYTDHLEKLYWTSEPNLFRMKKGHGYSINFNTRGSKFEYIVMPFGLVKCDSLLQIY